MSLGVIIVLYTKNSPIFILICTEYVNIEHNIPNCILTEDLVDTRAFLPNSPML